MNDCKSQTCALTYFFGGKIGLKNAIYHRIGDYTPGECYNTGFEVVGSRAYGLAVCQNCPGNCSNPVAFVTPEGFSQPTHDSQTWWYCQTTCTQPGDCP